MSEITIRRIAEYQLVAFIQKAYELSDPQGMGRFHYVPGPLSFEDARQIIYEAQTSDRRGIHMDYVKGRAVKLRIKQDVGGYYVEDETANPNAWYDHTAEQWRELMNTLKEF